MKSEILQDKKLSAWWANLHSFCQSSRAYNYTCLFLFGKFNGLGHAVYSIPLLSKILAFSEMACYDAGASTILECAAKSFCA